jgi:hypothetical protein
VRFTIGDHAPGPEGLLDGLRKAAAFIVSGARDPRVIAWARRACAGLPVTATPKVQAAAIYAAQRRDMTFVQDPYATELMQSAVVSLCLDPASECSPGGDCDDNVIVLGAALLSIGIPVRLLLREYPDIAQLHLLLQYDADPFKGGAWTCFDATTPTGACIAGYTTEQTVSLEVGPMMEGAPKILTMGQPPASATSSTPSSTTTAPGAAMPADQSAAWVALLSQTKSQLDTSAAALRSAATMLDAVRSDLGMPALDPEPAGGEAAGVSPLTTYATTPGYAWTASAKAAQDKLLQTADFCSQVLADGLSGARPLYWQSGDLYVGALSGDPYAVVMKPSASGSGALVPTYVDTSGASTGQVGFGLAPILLGLGIVALSLAAAYAVTKICDYLASAHRDDAVQKVASAQQALVASGQQTPEQATAFMKAAADLTSAPPPSAATGPKWTDYLAAGAVGLALGVVGAVVGNRVLSGMHLGAAPATA